MSEYDESIVVHAPPEEVFRYCSEVANLPRFLTTLDDARLEGPERVHLRGHADGHDYELDGELHVNDAEMRMDWGALTERRYHGWLTVTPHGHDARVQVHLSFEGGDQARADMVREGRDPDKEIRRGMKHTLDNLQHAVEHRGEETLH